MNKPGTPRTLQAICKKVVVLLDPIATKTAGGLALPPSAIRTNEHQWGTVCSAGDRAQHVEPGDRVLTNGKMGYRWTVGEASFVVMDETHILAKEAA